MASATSRGDSASSPNNSRVADRDKQAADPPGNNAMNRKKRLSLAAIFFCAALLSTATGNPGPLSAADWPTWRFDAARSGSTPHRLPEELFVQWVIDLPPLVPAWRHAPGRAAFDEGGRGFFRHTAEDFVAPGLDFDVAYQPVIAGDTLFLASSHDDSLAAFDTATGQEQWRFHAGGPVRFAPLVENNRVYFVADDGRLYCLAAANGELLWKFDGAPAPRLLLGNERLISMWPARGAPVSDGRHVYFSVGIWPFMGIFIYALDAENGAIAWVNDRCGALFIDEPHANAHSFSGLAPQGYLALAGDTLLVPNSRSVPGALDRRTGELKYLRTTNSKGLGQDYGGFRVMVAGDYWLHSGIMFDRENGSVVSHLGQRWNRGAEEIVSGSIIYSRHGETLAAHDLAVGWETSRDRRGRRIGVSRRPGEKWQVNLPPDTRLHLAAGGRLYLGAPGRVSAMDTPGGDGETARPAWSAPVSGTPVAMAAAGGRLFVSTREGRLYCFGAEPASPPASAPDRTGAGGPAAALARLSPQDIVLFDEDRLPAAEWQPAAARLLDQVPPGPGCALVLGAGAGGLAAALARQSALDIVVLEADPDRADRLRRRLAAAGLPARRVAVITGDLFSLDLPPYFARLVTAEAPGEIAGGDRDDFPARLFQVLRPYGGRARLPVTSEAANAAFSRRATAAGLEEKGGRVHRGPGYLELVRPGPLPGAGTWTHVYGDPGRTGVSAETRARAPLGLLWFGGPLNYNRSAGPLVVEGRVFVMGVDYLRATDAYTGQVLWEKPLPALTPDQYIGDGLLAAAPDGVYTVRERTGYRIDPASGRTLRRFQLPLADAAGLPADWGTLTIAGDRLIAAVDPIVFHRADGRRWPGGDSSSRYLAALDRYSGELAWIYAAAHGFRHDAIATGGQRVYCVDMTPDYLLHQLARHGGRRRDTPALAALDAASGRVIWRTTENVFASWLSYSARHDILLAGIGAGGAQQPPITMVGRDLPAGQAQDRLTAYRGAEGTVAWDRFYRYIYPFLVHEEAETIIFSHGSRGISPSALDLLTGEIRLQEHPLTGEKVPWSFTRAYGCNRPVAGRHLLTTRSGAAGYYDLAGEGGTGNFGGFRSGCRNNLVPADGLVNSPDMTARCQCAYALQTSLALVHMPEVETWTYNAFRRPDQDHFDARPAARAISAPVRRVGLNLGAPGDRRTADGLLWLGWPGAGFTPSLLQPKLEPEAATWFSYHTLRNAGGDGPAWVTASGAVGLQRLTIPLDPAENPPERRYTVRLYFSEPEELPPGERVFSVSLQGERLIPALDIARETGGPRRGLVREFREVRAAGALVLEMDSVAGRRPPLLSGVEITPAETAASTGQHPVM